MPPVTDLPVEIVLSIAEALPRNEILNLRNVCALFSQALACKALSRIIVNTRTSGGVDGLHSLRTLAQESEEHPVREWAQTIAIQDFTMVSANQESEALQWVQTISRNLTQIRSLDPQLSSLQALHLRGGQRYSSEWPSEEQNIFSVLKHSKIYLKEISSYATLPLFQYLSSYQDTLERLVISDSYWGPSSRASAAGFHSVLAWHKASLREVTLSAGLDDGWALGDNNQDLLKDPLPALELLSIPVFVKNSVPGDEDHLRSCLERGLDCLNFPLLRYISVDVIVDNASMRGVGTCGRYYPSMHKECTSTAFKRLYDYRFRTEGASKIPPTLTIGSQDFYPSLGDGGWQYKPRNWNAKNIDSQW
ncbi:hypothetical protein BKA70DRAFT_1560925 [Coprinopsis sp. MPI-PUGE-AT-0042]|nr:hypothetical protein BKA70DRAFT_1560925 [Coprinopsis sp. MPI-PUGE-AT-0042]